MTPLENGHMDKKAKFHLCYTTAMTTPEAVLGRLLAFAHNE
jgi:hypothetical protein